MDYRQIGIGTYGGKCEICGFGIVEIHHVDYKTHQVMENAIRKAVRAGEDIGLLLSNARVLGFLEWDNNQLSKDDRSSNLAVLCPNHHMMVHQADMGVSLLRLLPKRR
jgi:hypothetical protein